MKKELLIKILIMGVIVLFFSVGFQPALAANTNIFSLNLYETAWWKFDEGSGTTAYDSSGHGYDGNVVGATWTADGLSFDGTNDYVEFDAHATALGINKTDNFDIIIRFKSTGSGMLYSMSHTNPERPYFDLLIDDDGKVGLLLGNITSVFDLFTDGSYNDGEWHTFKCEFRGDPNSPTVNLFVDSVKDGEKTDWVCQMSDEDYETLKIGRNSNTEEEYFNGVIDDIKIYKNWWYHPHPPFVPTIRGPQVGKVGDILTFTFNAVDLDGDDVRFHIDWGDGSKEITVYVGSGTDETVTHIWSSKGDYTITAYAEDAYGWCGPSRTFQVVIPRNKAIINMLSQMLLEKYTTLERLLYFIL